MTLTNADAWSKSEEGRRRIDREGRGLLSGSKFKVDIGRRSRRWPDGKKRINNFSMRKTIMCPEAGERLTGLRKRTKARGFFLQWHEIRLVQ